MPWQVFENTSFDLSQQYKLFINRKTWNRKQAETPMETREIPKETGETNQFIAVRFFLGFLPYMVSMLNVP